MRKQHIAFLEERIDSKVQVVEVYGCWFWSCGGECYPRMLGFLSNEIIIVIFCQYLRIEAQWKNLNSLKLCQTLRRKEGTDYKINWEIRISCTVFELCSRVYWFHKIINLSIIPLPTRWRNTRTNTCRLIQPLPEQSRAWKSSKIRLV